MRFAVLVFPGSNCDTDCFKALRATGEQVDYVWHTASDLAGFDCVVIPGGFSYGDYLRPGAIARFAPVMAAVKRAASQGTLVLGICNGFQILLEAGLLPGAMLRNESLTFHCESVKVRVESNLTPFTNLYREGEEIELPVAHGDGNYYCDPATLEELRRSRRIVFRYAGVNPNGSLDAIAGISNEQGNVIGMMPHPERAANALLGSVDGIKLFDSIVKAWKEGHGRAAVG